jgi:hypothetical protein
MSHKKKEQKFMPIGLPARVRSLLLVAAVFCFAAPNGYFLYRYMKEPQLMQSLLANPLGLTFVSETALLLLLFLIAERRQKEGFISVIP